MVLMKGAKRLLDSVINETSTSATTRTASIYGITAYTELENKVLTILTRNAGTGTSTLNINSLGAKSIKVINGSSLIDPGANWVYSGEVYNVMYNGTYFILLSHGSSSSPVSVPIQYVSSAILDLTNSSTSQEITNAFGSTQDIQNFRTALAENKIIVLTNESASKQFIAVFQDAYSFGDGPTYLDVVGVSYVDMDDTSLLGMRIIALQRDNRNPNTYERARISQISFATKDDIGDINDILDAINGVVV